MTLYKGKKGYDHHHDEDRGQIHNLPNHLTYPQQDEIITLCRYLTDDWYACVDMWLIPDKYNEPPELLSAQPDRMDEYAVVRTVIVVGPDWVNWALENTIVFPTHDLKVKWQYSDKEGKIVTVSYRSGN